MQAQRKATTPFIKAIRPMVRDDVETLRQPSAPTVLQKLRDSHHAIARLSASGMKQVDIARAVGYSQTRVSIILKNPAMQDLIAKYRADEDEAHREARDEYYENIYRAGSKAWRQINDQLDAADESNEPIPLQRLVAIADSSADRIGHHKKSTQINVNVDFAAKLEKAIARSRKVPILELDSD